MAFEIFKSKLKAEYNIHTPNNIIIADPYFYNSNKLYKMPNYGFEYKKKNTMPINKLQLKQYTYYIKDNPSKILTFNKANIILTNKQEDLKDTYMPKDTALFNNKIVQLQSKNANYEIIVNDKCYLIESGKQNKYGSWAFDLIEFTKNKNIVKDYCLEDVIFSYAI